MHIKEEKIHSNKNTSVNKTKMLLFSVLLTMLFSLNSNAQCAMCRAVLETEEGGVQAEAVNDGIVYLMVFPYLLVGVLGFAIYRMKNKKNQKN